jgi:hypothetical protein
MLKHVKIAQAGKDSRIRGVGNWPKIIDFRA